MDEQRLRSICAEHGITVSLAGFVRESDVARLLDVKVRTLRQWRMDGVRPHAVRLGGTWRYSLDALAKALTPSAEVTETRQQPANIGSDGRALARDDAVLTLQKIGS